MYIKKQPARTLFQCSGDILLLIAATMLLSNVLERTFFLNTKENYQIKTLLEVFLVFSRILFAVSVALEYDISDRFYYEKRR